MLFVLTVFCKCITVIMTNHHCLPYIEVSCWKTETWQKAWAPVGETPCVKKPALWPYSWFLHSSSRILTLIIGVQRNIWPMAPLLCIIMISLNRANLERPKAALSLNHILSWNQQHSKWVVIWKAQLDSNFDQLKVHRKHISTNLVLIRDVPHDLQNLRARVRLDNLLSLWSTRLSSALMSHTLNVEWHCVF